MAPESPAPPPSSDAPCCTAPSGAEALGRDDPQRQVERLRLMIAHCEHRVRRHDGVLRHFAIRAVPVLEEDGAIREWVGVHPDVTGPREAEAERERLIGALRRSNDELDQFAYVASHDLEAPLRGTANLSQWIEEDLGEKVDAEGREHMRLLRGRVARLEALIDGILTYARAGRARREPEPVDTRELARDVVELLCPAPGAQVEIADDVPTLVAERVPLQQIFLNLVGAGSRRHVPVHVAEVGR